MKRKPATIGKISSLVIDNVLHRKRLFTLLDRQSSTRSFWISGPGGSGKTTLIKHEGKMSFTYLLKNPFI